MEQFTESLMNIDIFDFTDMDISEESFQYNNVTFKLDTLSKYNGLTVEVNTNWDMTVWNEDVKVISFNIIENEEFQKMIIEKIK